MLYLIIKTSIISIIFIFIVHNLIQFFKDTLTVPKMKDLVNYPQQRYTDIFNIISSDHTASNYITSGTDYTAIDLLPNMNETKAKDSMKDELKMFLKHQLTNDSMIKNNIEPYTG